MNLVAHERGLLELQQDGSHPTSVLCALVVLGVKVAHASHPLPITSGDVIVSLFYQCLLCLSVENKLLNTRPNPQTNHEWKEKYIY